MTKTVLISIILFTAVSPAAIAQTNAPDFSKASGIESALKQLVLDGVPGVSIAVYSKEGWWSSAAGFADIGKKMPMNIHHLQYLQSVSKTYMAIAILKLFEEGKIDLDAPITRYLPARITGNIASASQITVRMLLNHTSGIPEYNSIPLYVSKLLQQPEYPFTGEDYIRYIAGKPLSFAPGSKYSYRNTNYVLLALIADQITGDHRKFLRETIMKPLALDATYYAGDPGYLHYPDLTSTYWDRYSNGALEDATELQRNNVAALIGDDGVVATPADAVKFLRGLMEGKLLSPSTLELMKTWAKDSKGNPTYGLGLDYSMFAGKVAYGHSGGGLGAGCQLYYFPEKEVYFFVGINLGTVTDSPLHKSAMKHLEEIHQLLCE